MGCRKEDVREPRLAVFDTEGTTLKDYPAGPCACLYFWDFLYLQATPDDVTRDTVADVCEHVSGRDVSSLYARLDCMLDAAEAEGFYWVIGVHNFSYDAGYLRAWMTSLDDRGYGTGVVAKSSTKILTFTVKRGKSRLLTFFDTLSLFGCSLRTLGGNLGFPKLTLDYAEMYSPATPLPPGALAYNRRDTEVLMVGICTSLLKREGVTLADLGTRVLTKTSIVRKADREAKTIGALPLSVKRRKTKTGKTKRVGVCTVYDNDRDTVARYQFSSEDEYRHWASYGSTMTSEVKGFFAGGVNVSNANHIGQIMHDVVAYDLKSAYPAIMLSYRIPCDAHEVQADELCAYESLLAPMAPDPVDVLMLKCRFWYGTVRFRDVRMTDAWRSRVGDATVTQSMVLQNARSSKGLRFEDGYLVAATELVLTIAMPEFYEVCLQYEWGSASFESLTTYASKRMPTYYSTLRTVHHYHEKCVAKAVSKAYKCGERVSDSDIDAWEAAGYVTTDEASAIRAWKLDDAWVEGFVMAHKGNLNALYGINVTDPMKDEYYLDDAGYLAEDDDADSFDKYAKSSRDSLMWREAGVCIALFNRYKIAYMAALQVAAGAEVLYIDTDSIKSVGLPKETLDDLYRPLHDRIESATAEVVGRCFDAVEAKARAMRDSGRRVAVPDRPVGDDFANLGKLDYEGTYARFVTMGHKKYAYDEGAGWRVKCSGYDLGVLNALVQQMSSEGHDDVAPLAALAYDVRFDSSTKIATVQACVDETVADVSFLDCDGRLYEGVTCPGYAILDAGKIMNNTEGSLMNRQRYEAACRNNPRVREFSRTDVRRDGDTFTLGRRGTVPMDWSAWSCDWRGAQEVSA